MGLPWMEGRFLYLLTRLYKYLHVYDGKRKEGHQGPSLFMVQARV